MNQPHIQETTNPSDSRKKPKKGRWKRYSPMSLDVFEGQVIAASNWPTAEAGEFVLQKRVVILGIDDNVLRILPRIVDAADAVKVMQVHPRWILPRPKLEPLARLAESQRAVDWMTSEIGSRVVHTLGSFVHNRKIRDSWLRWQLSPKANMPADRPLFANGYLDALQKPNCRLVAWPVYQISSESVRTADGLEHRCDVLVYSTEFAQLCAQQQGLAS